MNDHELLTLYCTKENKISACAGIKNIVGLIIIEACNPKGIPSWLQRNFQKAFKTRFLLTRFSFYVDLWVNAIAKIVTKTKTTVIIT